MQNVQNLFWFKRKNYWFFYRVYSLLLSEAKDKVKYVRGHKILTSKQILQILRIALAPAKAVNTSENLLN